MNVRGQKPGRVLDVFQSGGIEEGGEERSFAGYIVCTPLYYQEWGGSEAHQQFQRRWASARDILNRHLILRLGPLDQECVASQWVRRR